ncbi:MAG TPA: trehalose-phosphatase [Acidimicrobiales bacterium]|nr:trehalose-phosphatase [Acidimicrobiales bacterium]
MASPPGDPGLGPLAALAADPPGSAVLTDFDGTLSPVVPDPERAVPLPGATGVLAALAERFALVAVVSGRPVRFLERQLAGAGPRVRLVGGYGVEWLQGGEVHRAPEVEPWLGPAAEVAAAARAEAPPGVGIEDKGFAVTLHWRPAPEAGPWAQEFAARWSERTGMVLQPGRLAVEFRPPVALDKGATLERLAAGCRAVCFMGDDAGDVAAFDALDRLAGSGVHGVRVAVADAESPPELVARADLVVDGPHAALALLDALARAAAAR